jgi:hypothetical protein
MTWLDLYKYLHSQANNIHNPEQFKWQNNVVLYDSETGQEYYCDTLFLENNKEQPRLVLAFNIEDLYSSHQN